MTIAQPLKEHIAVAVAKFMLGLPPEWHTVNSLLRKCLNVHWGNVDAVYERSHRSIVNQMRTRLLQEKKLDWPNPTLIIQWGMNSTPKDNRISPLKRLFGRAPLLIPLCHTYAALDNRPPHHHL